MRGTRPAWNTTLIQRNAHAVRKALSSPLHHAHILQYHLNTTIRTIVRNAPTSVRIPPNNFPTAKRLYHLSESDISLESDAFLSRSGPPSFEFPFTRDNYYMLLSYVPNRRWATVEGRAGEWLYYGGLHGNDLEWARRIYEQEWELLEERRRSHVMSGPR